MKKINLSSYRPIKEIQDNIIFANNGNVVLCYEGMLPEIYSLSEKDFEDIHGAWFQALKSLPVGCVVHKQDIYLKKFYSSEKLPNSSFLEKATHWAMEFDLPNFLLNDLNFFAVECLKIIVVNRSFS